MSTDDQEDMNDADPDLMSDKSMTDEERERLQRSLAEADEDGEV